MFGSLDRQHRLCEGFSSCIAESRDRRYIRHDLLKLIRQRVLQIVAGYEDCNDADTLRSDPMLKTVYDQLPESDPDLATQPTFSRLENSVTKKDLMRLSRWLLRRYVRSLKKRRPAKIILDLDSTDDHTHGQQEFAFYHRYYRNHILHPLLIFDADTGDLVCAVLRPGNKGAASHILPILKRVVEAIARLSARNPLAQARNRNLTSSCPQDRGPDPTNHSTHLGPSFLSLSRTTPDQRQIKFLRRQLEIPTRD